MLSAVTKTLRGLILNPILVAFARGLLESAVMGGLVFAADYASSDRLPDEYKLYGPLAVLVIRQLEGVADKIDAAKQRRRDVLRQSPTTDADGNPVA